MSPKPFVIYKSSAGSGKTYTLTMEYLKLALGYPDNFKSILAVTFTNKATAEMKERILKELKRLRTDVRPSEKMDHEILKHLDISEEALKRKASEALTSILHDYGRFSVSTIDSFFQKVVRSFAREMDLNAKFELQLDQDQVLDRVVERVVVKVMEDDFLHKWLVDFAIDQIQNGSSWDIRKNIKELGRQIFQEDFKKYAAEIREFLKEKENIKNLQTSIRKQKKEIIDICTQLKTEAEQIRINNGLEWTDFIGGSGSFAKKFDALGDKLHPVPELTATQAEKVNNSEKWYKKKDPNMERIEAAYHAGLNLILSQFDLILIKWNTLDAISKNIYVFGIFKNLLEELTLLKDEERMLLISDANEFLKEITKENDAPFIYEKVGNQYKNFLIDEFQDTSAFQWASFKPLLENSLSQGFTNLLVGDVKQSIYRWRGGEMKLLLEQVESEIGSEKVKNENLDTNFRSLPNIIAFNNAIFKKLPIAFETVVSDTYGGNDTEIISRAYHDVVQKVSERKAKSLDKGKVRFEFVDVKDSEDDGNFDAHALAKLPSMVMELQQKGYNLKDIAFLVRKKDHGEAIADCLMAYDAANPELPYRFDVLSDEAMYLHKSASVKALVAALKYLYDPEDKVQVKTMWYYYAMLNGKAVDHDLFALEKMPDFLIEKEKSFLAKVSILLQLPMMEAVEELIAELELQETGLEKAYISGFKEAVFDFTANNRADLAGFLEWWEENKEKRTVKIPEGHNAMRILTIHKSKGLQFKVVLLPFLKWTIFDTSKKNVVWAPFENQQQGLSAIIPLTLNKLLAKSDFSETYSQEAILAYLDSLNMIYVALTRAEEVIWGLVPYKEITKTTSLNNLEIQLQQVLSNSTDQNGELSLADHYDAETKIFDFGVWPENPASQVESLPMKPLRWAYQGWTELLKVKKYAVDFSKEGIAQRQKRNFGTLIHEILEKSKTHTEALSALNSCYHDGRISLEEKNQVEIQLEDLFASPLFASWFGTEGLLLAEQGILLPGGKHKRPDRIILNLEDTVIVDFKTGEESERHSSQVKEYMALVAELTSKKSIGYLCYLETGKIIKVNA